MNRKNLLLLAIAVGNITVTAQLPLSLAQGNAAASAFAESQALHAGNKTTAPVVFLTSSVPTAAPSAKNVYLPLPLPKDLSQLRAVRQLSTPTQAPKTAASVYLADVTTQNPSLPSDPLAALVQPDIKQQHQDLARSVLSLLPEPCERSLSSFYVVYNQPSHRGAGGNGVMILNGSLPDAKFKQSTGHEMTHFWDLTCTTGTQQSGASAFTDGKLPIWNDDPSVSFYGLTWLNNTTMRPGTVATDFVSGYAATDPFEDLAETGVYFLFQREAFEARAKKSQTLAAKLSWMKQHYPIQQTLATGSVWAGVIPYDAAEGREKVTL